LKCPSLCRTDLTLSATFACPGLLPVLPAVTFHMDLHFYTLLMKADIPREWDLKMGTHSFCPSFAVLLASGLPDRFFGFSDSICRRN
jgi:hypothetical protein